MKPQNCQILYYRKRQKNQNPVYVCVYVGTKLKLVLCETSCDREGSFDSCDRVESFDGSQSWKLCFGSTTKNCVNCECYLKNKLEKTNQSSAWRYIFRVLHKYCDNLK
jgi:hypothetical protein